MATYTWTMYTNLANLKDLFKILLKHWQIFLQKIIKFVKKMSKICKNVKSCAAKEKKTKSTI